MSQAEIGVMGIAGAFGLVALVGMVVWGLTVILSAAFGKEER